MGEVGLLPMDDPSVELIDGQVIDVAAFSPWHAAVNSELAATFLLHDTEERTVVSVRNPIRFDEINEAVPDVLLLEHRRSYYGDRHPGPSDAYLLIEVADSAIDYVREVKVPLYARFGMREVWVIDLKDQAVSTFREPAGGAFTSVAVVKRGGFLAPTALPQFSIAVDHILGRGRGTLYE